MAERSPLVPVLFFVVKLLSLAVGGLFTVLGLMAVAGAFTESGWARLGIALAVAIIIPAVVADRLLPKNMAKGKGIVTDVFAIAWMGTALVLVGFLGGGPTRDLLAHEAIRLDDAGYSRTAQLLAWTTGGVARSSKLAGVEAPSVDAAVATGPAQVSSDAASAADAGPVADGGSVAKVDEADVELSPSDLFKKWSPAVVTIQGPTSRYGSSGGTGFIVDESGLIVTNHHVVDGMTKVSVKLIDDKWAAEVELLMSDQKLDIAVLRIKTSAKLTAVRLGDSEAVTVGEKVVSIGNPLGLEHTLTDGLVSQRRIIEGRKMIQMSTPISPGNSGGPLFNLKGQVVGVSTASLSGHGRGQNLNLAVPINVVQPMLKKKKYPDRKRVGGGSPSGGGKW